MSDALDPQNTPLFEGAYFSQLPVSARLECKICWWVYDPQMGDSVWQIPAGIPFSQLPEHWRCPVCDNPRSQFLLLQD